MVRRGAAWWKALYESERRELGPAGLDALLERVPAAAATFPPRGALVFPHALLRGGGEPVAAAARAVVETGCDEVLALGVLHGARERDAALVKAARSGDAGALSTLRRVHGPGTERDEERWAEEFSLDSFAALLQAAARRAGRKPPRIRARFPFLVGRSEIGLPGLPELRACVEAGMPIVATADHLHHGAGYGTPAASRLRAEDPAARVHARTGIEASFELLRSGNVPGFLRLAHDLGSDFRDPGPVLAAILGRPWEFRVRLLELVGYEDVLGAEAPTWVAAALVEVAPDPDPAPARPQGRCG